MGALAREDCFVALGKTAPVAFIWGLMDMNLEWITEYTYGVGDFLVLFLCMSG